MEGKFLRCRREMPVTIAWTEEILSWERDTILTWEGSVVERFVRNNSSKVTGILSLPDDFLKSSDVWRS